MTCKWLGEKAKIKVKIGCGEGYGRERARRCNHPDHRLFSGKPGICLEIWPGPWEAKQKVETELIHLCKECSKSSPG